MIELITINVQCDNIQYSINKELIYREDVHFLPMDVLWKETNHMISLCDFKNLLADSNLDDKDSKECMQEDILYWIDKYFILFMTEYSISDILLNWVNIENTKNIPPIISWSQFWCIYRYVCVELLSHKYKDLPEEDTCIEWYQEKWYEHNNKGTFSGSYSDIIATTPCICEHKIIDVQNKYT